MARCESSTSAMEMAGEVDNVRLGWRTWAVVFISAYLAYVDRVPMLFSANAPQPASLCRSSPRSPRPRPLPLLCKTWGIKACLSGFFRWAASFKT